jgi:hypothetical protein
VDDRVCSVIGQRGEGLTRIFTDGTDLWIANVLVWLLAGRNERVADRSDVGPERGRPTAIPSQNGNPSKINPEKVACFSSPKNDRQLTSFHQQSTTNSPSKNHVLHPVFAKTPSKNASYPGQKKILQNDKQKVMDSGGVTQVE